jgi:hypothetical protein
MSMGFIVALENVLTSIHSVVVDEIDQIENPEAFLNILGRSCCDNDLRLLVSSRESESIAHRMAESFDVSQPLTITDYNSEDLSKFVAAKAELLVEQNPALSGTIDLITSMVNQKANGMFQWINSVFEQLKHIRDAEDVEPSLNYAEENLLNTYDRLFTRLSSNRSEVSLRRIRTSFMFLATSATPVTAADVKFSYLVQELMQNEPWRESHIFDLFNPETNVDRVRTADKEMLLNLGPAVNISPEGTLQFMHSSVQQYLTQRVPTTGWESVAERVRFSPHDAHRVMAEICMAVCASTTFVHANSFSHGQIPLVQYAWTYWAYHLHHSQVKFEASTNGFRLRRLFDRMIHSVTVDSLEYVDALVEFASRPSGSLPGTLWAKEYAMCLKRAQDSLSETGGDHCDVLRPRHESISMELAEAREETSASMSRPTSLSIMDTARYGLAKVSKLLRQHPPRFSIGEYLEKHPWLPPQTKSSKLLLKLARSLRMTALSFAIEPVYSILLQESTGTSFSPLHPLVYVAQLTEEGGRYPYWEAMPPSTDLMERFIRSLPESDPVTAKFLLHCFEWRDVNKPDAVVRPTHAPGRIAGQYKPLSRGYLSGELVKDGEDSSQPLQIVDTENPVRAVIRRYTTGDDSEFDSESKPVGQIDVTKNSPDFMHEGEADDQKPFVYSSVQDIPYLVLKNFVNLVFDILQHAGHIALLSLRSYLRQVRLPVTELLQSTKFIWRLYDPADLPPIGSSHVLLAICLFYLRCRFFPSWDAYAWSHEWDQLQWVFRYPLQYLEMQSSYSFWQQGIAIFMFFFSSTVGLIATAFTQDYKLSNGKASLIITSYAVFHSICSLERSLLALVTTAATILAACLIMLHDIKSAAAVFKLGIWFWFLVIIQSLFLHASAESSLKSGNRGRVAMVGGTLLYLAILYLAINKSSQIVNYSWRLTGPLRQVVIYVWRDWLGASAVLARYTVVTVVIWTAVYAFNKIHRPIWDPYNMKASMRRLVRTSRVMKSALRTAGVLEVRRIGCAPIGVWKTNDLSPKNVRPLALPSPPIKAEELEENLKRTKNRDAMVPGSVLTSNLSDSIRPVEGSQQQPSSSSSADKTQPTPPEDTISNTEPIPMPQAQSPKNDSPLLDRDQPPLHDLTETISSLSSPIIRLTQWVEQNSGDPGVLFSRTAESKLLGIIRELEHVDLKSLRLDTADRPPWTNFGKEIIEDTFGETWNWWPLVPRMRKLLPREVRLHWHCVSPWSF